MVPARENINLLSSLVRADERVGAHRAHRVDRELLVLCVAHERDVGVDVLHHLAAGRAGEAGLAFRCALHRRGGIARSAHAVAAAAENECVRQCAALCRGAKTRRRIGFCKIQKLHCPLHALYSARISSANLKIVYRKSAALARKSAPRDGKTERFCAKLRFVGEKMRKVDKNFTTCY